MRTTNNYISLLTLTLVAGFFACSSLQEELVDMDNADASVSAKYSYLTLRWDQPRNVGSYNLSNLMLDESMMNPKVRVYLGGGYTDTRYLFSIDADDSAIPLGNGVRFFDLRFGWAPELNRQGIGANPANWLELKLNTADIAMTFCYSKPTAANLYDIKTGQDSAGKYVEVNTGPLPIFVQENQSCEGSSPRMPHGTMSVVAHYRCKALQPLEFPKWACQ